MNKNLLGFLQKRVAENAAGATALRNLGNSGVVAAARRFLKLVNLSKFSVNNADQFLAVLDKCTNDLKKSLPQHAKHWGAARKVLNLFLRDVLYNRYLYKRFGFQHLERWLEVPLDSYVAKNIRAKYRSHPLPPWPGLKHLTPKVSQAYQEAASAIASKPRFRDSRVHLDIIYWHNVGQNELCNKAPQPTRPKGRE